MPVSRNFLTQPFDPSLGGNWTAGQAAELTQFLQLATPDATAGATLGWFITSASSPNVVTYPELTKFLWLKPVSASVQELYAWNGTSWQQISTLATIADGSLALTKLATVLADAGKVIQYSVIGVPTAVTLGSLIAADSIPWNALENAAPLGSMYILIADETTGVWTSVLWNTAFQEQLATLPIPIAGLHDSAATGIAGQVPAVVTTGTYLGLRYVEDLLRANQTPTSKLIYPAGSAGKMLVVAASGLDVEAAVAPVVPKPAILTYSRTGLAANALAQSFANGGATATCSLSAIADYDPDAILSGLTGTGFSLEAGLYAIDITVPIKTNLADSLFCRVQLYDGSGVVVAQNAAIYGYTSVHLSGILRPSVTTAYTLQVVPSADGAFDFSTSGIGPSAGLGGAEVFTSIRVLKLSDA